MKPVRGFHVTHISPSLRETTTSSEVTKVAWEQSMVTAMLPAELRSGKLVETSETELSEIPTVGELWLR